MNQQFFIQELFVLLIFIPLLVLLLVSHLTLQCL